MRWLRDVHLLLGMFCLPFLAVYAVDGVSMTHRAWVPEGGGHRVEERSFAVRGSTPEAIASDLASRHGVAGYFALAPAPGVFYMQGPLASYEVSYDAGAGTALVRTHRGGIKETVHNLHMAAGVTHASGAANLWGAFALCISLGLVVLGGTGLWLWTRRLKQRRLGLVFLLGSLGYCALCLVLIVTA